MPASTLFARRLALLQSYKEVTWGTTAAATAKWMGLSGVANFKSYRKATPLDEARGNLAPAFLAPIMKNGGEFKIPMFGSYEEILFPLFGLAGSVATSGSSAPYTYSHPLPTTAQPVLSTYTFEYNQNGIGTLAKGSILNKMSVKGEVEKAWALDISGICQDVDPTWSGSPAVLSDRVVEPILMAQTALFMDVASTGSAGTTAMSGVLTDFTWTVENSVKAVYVAGSLTPAAWVVSGPIKSELELGLLWTAATRAFINTNLNAGLQALVQLKATSGTKSATLNFNGAMSDDPEYFGEKDGAEMVKVKLSAVYNLNAGLYSTFITVNGVANLP
jgi:hypothetical protein